MWATMAKALVAVEAMKAMMELKPETKVILASGYTDTKLDTLNPTPLAFLPKPFTIKELTRSLDLAMVQPAGREESLEDPGSV